MNSRTPKREGQPPGRIGSRPHVSRNQPNTGTDGRDLRAGLPVAARFPRSGTDGEVIVAFVVPDPREAPDLGTLRAHCRASLADYKAPDRLELVTELPTTTLGKIDTRALKALAASEQEGART